MIWMVERLLWELIVSGVLSMREAGSEGIGCFSIGSADFKI
jgi:hypothetical protein